MPSKTGSVHEVKANLFRVLGHPALKEWIDAAKHEPWLISQYELA